MTYTTKDSGEREQYDSGMVRDTQKGKPRFDLLVPKGVPYEEQYLTRIAMLMARGAEKYGDRNWELGNGMEEYQRALASAFRHFMQWFVGVEDGEDHAAAVFFNIMQAEYLARVIRNPDGNAAPQPRRIPVGTEITSIEVAGYLGTGQVIRDRHGNLWRKVNDDEYHDIVYGEITNAHDALIDTFAGGKPVFWARVVE